MQVQELFASWGVDYVKMDWCGDNKTLDSQGRAEGHLNFSRALNQTGRPMAFELCRGPYQKMDHWVRLIRILTLAVVAVLLRRAAASDDCSDDFCDVHLITVSGFPSFYDSL